MDRPRRHQLPLGGVPRAGRGWRPPPTPRASRRRLAGPRRGRRVWRGPTREAPSRGSAVSARRDQCQWKPTSRHVRASSRKRVHVGVVAEVALALPTVLRPAARRESISRSWREPPRRPPRWRCGRSAGTGTGRWRGRRRERGLRARLRVATQALLQEDAEPSPSRRGAARRPRNGRDRPVHRQRVDEGGDVGGLPGLERRRDLRRRGVAERRLGVGAVLPGLGERLVDARSQVRRRRDGGAEERQRDDAVAVHREDGDLGPPRQRLALARDDEAGEVVGHHERRSLGEIVDEAAPAGRSGVSTKGQ